MSRSERTADTKDKILTTAERFFAVRGYEAVGVQEICQEAAVTKPTLYYHFKSKEGLLRAVTATARRSFLEALSPYDYSGDLVRDVRSLFTRFSKFRDERPEQFRLIVQMIFPPELSALANITTTDTEEIRSAFQVFFVKAAEAHGNLRGKERHLAVTFLGHALAFTSTTNPTSTDIHAEPTVLAAQTFLYGIF